MTIDLEKLQGMWEKDSKIDPDNLHQESLNIPVLHSKYYEIYNNVLLLRARADQRKKNIRHSRYEYFTGKADDEVYRKEPFGKKLRDKDAIQKYLDADESLSSAGLKVQYYDTMIKYLEDIIKTIHNRSYHINNAIEFMKFQSGMG
nr:Recombination, repair and ssDNA binding protein UvsY [uncultured Mediterranean phage uvMED]|tara:strand:+ start:3295 stop:3732 length:438 start_codon:yes stop_codon:yes gene_type:complete